MALEDATNPMQGVSGPGKFARRTDLQYQPDTYGAGVQYAAEKAGAPLAKAPKSPMLSEAPQVPTSPLGQVTSLYAPTERPTEPITHGISLGAGGGPEVLSMPDQAQGQYINAYEMFNKLASNPEASPTLKYLAQRIQQGF